MSDTNLQLHITNNLDIIPVNNNYEIVNKNTSLAKILITDGNKIIPITKLNISSHGLTNVYHTVTTDTDNGAIISIVFNEGSIVLKNSGINISAICNYKKKQHTLQTEIKYLPFKKDEICKLAPSSDIIKADNNLKYNPPFLKIQISREFDGEAQLFDSYKDYRITYQFSDDLSEERPYYAGQYIDCFNTLNTKDKIRLPDFMLLNLYKNSSSNIPEQTIQLKIKRSDEFIKAQQTKLVLDKEIDNIITDENYIITSDTYINTSVIAYIDSIQQQILLSNEYPIDIDVKIEDPDFNNDIDIEIIPELQDTGILDIHLLYNKGITIPKKMILHISAYVQTVDKIIIQVENQFTINATPSFSSIYQLQPNANAIRVNKENYKDPLIIGVNKYKWCGNNRELTNDGFVMYKIDSGDPEIYNEPLDTKDVQNNVIFEYYNNDMVLMDRSEIYVVFDGSELIEDELVESNKFYFASDHDDSDDYIPGPEENWIPNIYPNSDTFNIVHPYLWMYESKIYKNPTTGNYYPVTTEPTIISIFNNVLIPIQYYYAGEENTKISYEYNATDNNYYVKNGDNLTDTKWDDNLLTVTNNIIDKTKPQYLWQLLVYQYYNSAASMVLKEPVIIHEFKK